MTPSDDRIPQRDLGDNTTNDLEFLKSQIQGLRNDLGTVKSLAVISGIVGLAALGLSIYLLAKAKIALLTTPISAPIVVRGGTVGAYSNNCWAERDSGTYITTISANPLYVYLGNVIPTSGPATPASLELPLEGDWKVTLTFTDDAASATQHRIKFRDLSSSQSAHQIEMDGSLDGMWDPMGPTMTWSPPAASCSGSDQMMVSYHVLTCGGASQGGESDCNHLKNIEIHSGTQESYKCLPYPNRCWVGFGQSSSSISICTTQDGHENLCRTP